MTQIDIVSQRGVARRRITAVATDRGDGNWDCWRLCWLNGGGDWLEIPYSENAAGPGWWDDGTGGWDVGSGLAVDAGWGGWWCAWDHKND